MKSDWHTPTEKRQMQQSVTLAFFRPEVDGLDAEALVSVLPPPSALSCWSALVLMSAMIPAINRWAETGSHVLPPRRSRNLLECVGTRLPLAPDLDAHLDAAVHLLSAALVVDTELEDVAVLEQLRARLHIRAR